MNKLKNANYIEFFPENLRKYNNLKALAQTFEEEFKLNIVNNIENLAYFYSLEKLNDTLLDEFAWGFNIEEYKDNLERSIKIKLIKAAYWAHSKKGTKNAVVKALENLNYAIFVKEWFEYGGQPFTFKIITENKNKDSNWLKEVINLINKNKNTRSILEAIYTLTKKNKNYYIGAYKQVIISSKKNNSSKDKEMNKNIYLGMYRTIRKERTYEI